MASSREIRELIAQTTTGTHRRHVPREVRDEVRRHAKRRRAQGATWEAISKETGLEARKLRVWCRTARATASVPALRPVEVVTEPEPTGLVVVAPSGLWPGLVRFLGDPKIPLDTNGVERALRGVAVGRKNHYGSRSERGTRVAALFYSLLESAKPARAEPRAYLGQASRRAIQNPGTVTLARDFKQQESTRILTGGAGWWENFEDLQTMRQVVTIREGARWVALQRPATSFRASWTPYAPA